MQEKGKSLTFSELQKHHFPPDNLARFKNSPYSELKITNYFYKLNGG